MSISKQRGILLHEGLFILERKGLGKLNEQEKKRHFKLLIIIADLISYQKRQEVLGMSLGVLDVLDENFRIRLDWNAGLRYVILAISLL